MGKRSRKRTGGARSSAPSGAPPTEPAPAASPHARTLDRRARLDELPKAPWSPFPLTELTIFLSLVLIVVGVVGGKTHRALFLGVGIALVTLASTEQSLREHYAGFRSHSGLLAGMTAIVVDVPLYFATSLPQSVLLIVGLIVFGGTFYYLRRVFQDRTGGLGYRV